MTYIESLLGEHEKLVYLTHQHWMRLIPAFFGDLALSIFVVGIAFVVTAMMGNPIGLVAAFLVAVPVVLFVRQYLEWLNQEYVITNRRVIQIEGVVNKSVTDSSLEKVNDVKMSQSIFGRLLDYGDIEILTASELGANLFHHIYHPIKFKTAMLNAKEELEMGGAARAEGEPTPTAPDIPTMIAGLDQLRKQGLITEAEYESKKQELLSRL